MKAGIIFLLAILGFTACQSNLQKKDVLVKNTLLSKDKYLIVCKGYPGNNKVGKVQRIGLAKEAALVNAQVLARKFIRDDIDVIKHGVIRSIETYNDYVVLEYVIEFKNIKKFLK